MHLSLLSKEEQLNTVSHAVGVIFGTVGLVLLLLKNHDYSRFSVFSILVYSVSFVLLFLASTLYHYHTKVGVKDSLRVCDHISIYMLIAGTYTPVSLITLEQGNGWNLFYIVWGIALVGAILKFFFTGKYEYVSLLLYLVMGWLIVVEFNNVVAIVGSTGANFLILGGLFYSFGIVFYAINKIPYNHFIWHLFVLAGAISHWCFIYFYVV